MEKAGEALVQAQREFSDGNWTRVVALLEPLVRTKDASLALQLERDVVGLLSRSFEKLRDEKAALTYSERYTELMQQGEEPQRYGSMLYSAEDEELYRASLAGEYESPYGGLGVATDDAR
jgi:hypothetical protein